MHAPGGIEAQADVWAGVFKNVPKHLDIAQPVVSAVIMDSEFDIVFFGEALGGLQSMGHAGDVDVVADHFSAGGVAELEPFFFQVGAVLKCLDTDAGEFEFGGAEFFDDSGEARFRADIGVDFAEFHA